MKEKIKLLLLLSATTFFVFVKSITILCVSTLILTFSVFIIKAKKNIKNRIRPLIIVGFFVISFQMIFNHPADLIERFLQGLAAAERIFILSMLVFLYTSLTSSSQILKAFSFFPKKIKFMLLIIFSMIPTIFDEYNKINLVQVSRGFRFNSLHPQKNLFPLIIPLFHRTLKRADQIAITLISRGYQNE